jgi:adenylyltransferase/sulfurtransferase
MLGKIRNASTAEKQRENELAMSIEVKISSIFHPYTDNRSTVEVEGNTVGECIEDLVKQVPKLKKILFDNQGKLHRQVNLYVNQESSPHEELGKPVKYGDTLRIIMTIAGG